MNAGVNRDNPRSVDDRALREQQAQKSAEKKRMYNTMCAADKYFTSMMLVLFPGRISSYVTPFESRSFKASASLIYLSSKLALVWEKSSRRELPKMARS